MAEYIRLRAACKEWRRCTADPREGCNHLDPRFRPRRWIMLSNRTNGDGRRFLNLSTGASARVDLPELSRHHLEASTEGLLLLRDKASHAVVMDVIRVEHHVKAQRWSLIQVFEVDVAGKRLVPAEDIGRHRAVLVGDVACFSLLARRFPCVAGNAVYMGARGACCPPVGVRYLADKAADPSFVFTTDAPGFLDCISVKQYRQKIPELNLVPLARPCTLQEYLVCCAGLLGGLKD
ncbi:hypothetical protein CFC21_021592 [Triticum aestivum]|uniref:KIB1-4 beta-propeller domain-containing protein n=2 Tax=Triticum aestivum TaxID=4565 RepID=A0A9R1EAP2_WHEAT|nr:hypothetical protein CFC21_021592 [Triticum aestivum]